MLKVYLLSVIVVSAALGSSKAADPACKSVSKTVSLGKYTPHDLVSFKGVQVSKRIVQDLERLLEAAKKDGLTLKVVSGYRSYSYQENVFSRWTDKELAKNPKLSRRAAQELANTYSARPGHSEHQLGTVVDVLSAENNYSFNLIQSLSTSTGLKRMLRSLTSP